MATEADKPSSHLSKGIMVSLEQIQVLYDKYLAIVELEVSEFGVRPTELRHLIGRLGEFHCALAVRGTLAHECNQHGFDVVGIDGRRISVKTTAQKVGFVTINPRTLDRVDDLMVVIFADGKLSTLYHGPAQLAVDNSRPWGGNHEFEISSARKLGLAHPVALSDG